MRSAEEIRRIAGQLEASYGDRNKRYRQNWLAYKGDFHKLSSQYDLDDGTDDRRRTNKRVMVWNLIKPIVDTHRLLINRLPSISVPPIRQGDPEVRGKNELIEKALYALWDESDMTKRHGEATFTMALNYASVWFVRWDQERNIPVITTRDPAETLPVMKRDGSAVSYCLFKWEDEADNIVENFPQAKGLLDGRKGSATVECIEYVDADQYSLVVGDRKVTIPVAGGKTKLGCCPVVITSGSYLPGEIFPPGPVDQLVHVNHYLNRFQTKWGDALENVLFGFHVITAEDEVPFNTGPNAVNYLGPQDGYQYVQPQAPPSEVFGHLQMIQSFMRTHANWPESASGEFDASIITGRAVSRLQGIMGAMAAENQANLAASLQTVNHLLLKMMETYQPKKTFTLSAGSPITGLTSPGRPQGFSVEVIPERDIAGFHNNQLYYSPFGADMAQAMNLGMQGIQSDIFSRRWVIDQVPGVQNAEGMVKEIEEEKRRAMSLEMELQNTAQIQLMEAQAKLQQQAAPPAEGAMPPEGGMPPEGAPPAGGAIAPGGPTLLPTGQPEVMGMGEPLSGEESFPLPFTKVLPFNAALSELAPEEEAGDDMAGYGEEPVTVDEVAAAISQVKKLKGEVYIIGELAKRGQTSSDIALAITDKLDKQTLINALREWNGRLSFTVVPPGQPPQPNVPVRGGATGGVPEETQAA